MLKKELRITYREKRNLLPQSSIVEKSTAIANRMLNVSVWHFFYFHIYLSITRNKEVDTTHILTILQGEDKNIVVPKTSKDRTLEHYLLLDNTRLEQNRLDIPEPVEGIPIKETDLDVVFVPLLAFDKKGHRVGYGKGYYDVFLKKCRPDVIKIGLSFFEAEEEITDVNEDDVALNYCVTPDKIYTF
ncbi:MAG: 5-formyltetrahydrofolate cyclo-ligase [Bacteroidota bacterium]